MQELGRSDASFEYLNEENSCKSVLAAVVALRSTSLDLFTPPAVVHTTGDKNRCQELLAAGPGYGIKEL